MVTLGALGMVDAQGKDHNFVKEGLSGQLRS